MGNKILLILLSCLVLSCMRKEPEVKNTPTFTVFQETPQLVIETSTKIITQTATWTPVSTLPADIQKKNLINLFITNGDCDFPCWWGIKHGDSIQKVTELAPILGESINTYRDSSYFYTLSLGTLNLPDLNVGYDVDSNQNVQKMEVILDEPSRFRDYHNAFESHLALSSILNKYGKPSEVLFLVQPRFEPGEVPRSYTLFVIYDLLDFGVVYSGIVDSENPLQVCSIKFDSYSLESVSLYLQNPRAQITKINRFNSVELFPLEQVTSMSIDNFHQKFSEYEYTNCIEAIIDPWQ